MKSNVVDYGDIKVIEIHGKITIGEGDVQLRRAVNELLESGAKKIVLNLSGLKYIDSSGIGELVSCYTTITNRGGQLRICNLHSKIYSLLQLTSLVTVFQIYDSVEDAMQSFD
ncbi:Anti-sigma factor antagonist [Sulfidibacter corallicola]|uniref:Anti-sigma factor antagonist n=1 Tax=Sulfidibacter corallicola TaxID=2818388 RepID=A0A8A4TWF5_SULCO|nr:STAS domain-containing protein [Sulfidibacter corallicola]QTD54296.1 STAS domain-containing protein [Sulfidibacter corallicola]